MKKRTKTQQANTRRHKFLNEMFFPNSEGYEVKTLGEWVLVRQWNGGSNRWEVAIWEKDTYRSSQLFYQDNVKDED